MPTSKVLCRYLGVLAALLGLSCSSSKVSDEHSQTALPPGSGMTQGPDTGSPPPLTLPPPDPFAATDAALAALPWGNIAYNPPTKMRLGETRTIELLLSPKVPIETLKNQIRTLGEKEAARIRISNQMRARLTGNGFGINAITQEKQSIGTDPTRWQWDIQAIAKGTHQLHLTLTVVINVDGTDQERNLDTFDKTIQVEVTPWQTVANFASSNWQWMWAVLLTPLVGWMWRRSRKRQGAAP